MEKQPLNRIKVIFTEHIATNKELVKCSLKHL